MKNYNHFQLLKITLCIALTSLIAVSSSLFAETLVTSPVKQIKYKSIYSAEGVVEAVRTTQISTEMQGSIIALLVKAGDSVKSGQVLARIDTRVANQQVAGSKAQALAAEAQLSVARQTYARKKRLFDKQYISQAALEQAEAEYKSAEAQTHAQQSEISIANVRTGLHTVIAPYNGIVAEVTAELGDMALPGKPLLVLYDPKSMRVVASVPQDRLSKIVRDTDLEIEIPGSAQPSFVVPTRSMTVLPVADAVSHQMQVRVALPSNLKNVVPGMFSRLKLASSDGLQASRLYISSNSVMRRGELALVYVLIGTKVQLRQVKLGLPQGELIEVLSGVEAGEKVVLNPLAAIAVSAPMK